MTDSLAAPDNGDQPESRRSEAQPHWETAEQSACLDLLIFA
jgi:hypothetical protein